MARDVSVPLPANAYRSIEIFTALIESDVRFCGISLIGIFALIPEASGSSLCAREVTFVEMAIFAVITPVMIIKIAALTAEGIMTFRFMPTILQSRFCESTKWGTIVNIERKR